MATTIKLKNSVTTTNAPSSLVQGEVAINITDKKVWVGNAATTPIQLLGGGADGNFTNISVSSVATFGAGTVSAPSITTTGDTNTGIFFPAADTIAFTEGGVEALRIDSSGNVGIGTTAPIKPLSVEITSARSATTDNEAIRVSYGTNSGVQQTVAIGFATSVSNTYPAAKIELLEFDAVDARGNLLFYTRNDNADSAPTERMRINFAGDVLLNQSSSFIGTNTTDGADSSGIIVGGGGGASVSRGSYLYAYGNEAASDAGDVGLVSGNIANSAVTLNAYPATGTIEFSTANAERMRITSAGEVLVGGTTSISANSGALTLQRTDAETILNLYRADTSISSGNTLGSIRFYGNDTTSNTPTQLASIEAIASGTHAAGDNPTDLVFACTNDGTGTVAEFGRVRQAGTTGRLFEMKQGALTDGNEVAVYASGGTSSINRYASVGVYKHSGITNACGYQSLYAEDGAANYLWVDNSDILRISTTFAHVGTTSGTVVGAQTSDERIKNIIGEVPYGLNEVLAINPVEFTLKSDESNTKKLGFIAQQVMPFVPESVFDTGEVIVEGEPTKLGMEYVALIPVLVNAIKELNAKVEKQAAEIAALKGA